MYSPQKINCIMKRKKRKENPIKLSLSQIFLFLSMTSKNETQKFPLSIPFSQVLPFLFNLQIQTAM